MNRALSAVAVAATALCLGLPTACGSNALSSSCFPPYIYGPVSGVPQSCRAGYLVVRPSDCPPGCSGAVAYAICIGSQYTACSCTPPPGMPLMCPLGEAGLSVCDTGSD